MIRIPSFVGFVVVLIVGLYAVAVTPPSLDPFADKQRDYLANLGPMTPPALARAKLRHAQSRPTYEVGLFGNSRVLMVGAEAIGQKARTFFNFAVPSEALSGTVMLLEELALRDKLPDVVVVGLDNFYLHRDNSPIWPSFAARFSWAIGNVLAALRTEDVTATLVLRRLWRAYWGETVRFEMVFGPTTVRAGTARILGLDDTLAASDVGAGYRADGSHVPVSSAPEIAPISITASRPDIDLFLRNLERLGALAASGSLVYVLETPIYPTFQRQFDMSPPPEVSRLRDAWQDACRANGLRCVDAPLLPVRAGQPWYDSTHAPEAIWAAHIAGILGQGRR